MLRRICAFAVAATGSFVSASYANLTTGFEAPSYSVGTIVGQNGWTDNDAMNGPHGLFNVTTTNPKTGSQAVAISDGSYMPPGSQYGYSPELISPASGTGTAGTTTSFNIDISGVTQSSVFPPPLADHRIYVVSDPSADVDPRYGFNDYAAGLDFAPDGRILAETYSPDFGGFLSLNETGATWTPNVYQAVSIVVDPTTTTLKYYYDGTLLATTTAFYETAVHNVVFLNDTVNAPSERETIDNLSITAVPEPTTVAALGGAAALLVWRRRSTHA